MDERDRIREDAIDERATADGQQRASGPDRPEAGDGDNEPARTVPDPESRRRGGQIEGIPIRSGGHTWLLAEIGLARVVNEHRDRLYNDQRLYDDVGLKDIRACAWYMLTVNYDLDAQDAIAVMAAADEHELIDAVVRGVFVHLRRQESDNYTNWARSCLISNSIDPAAIAKDDMPHVLRQLVATRRAMPLAEFTAADCHATLLASIRVKV